MTPRAEVAEIAGKLTAGNRYVVRLGGEIFGMPCAASVIRSLIRRGLFARQERKGFQTRWSLTPLGIEVRAYLLETQG